MTNTVLIILAITAALAVSTWSRVPWARARAKRRREQRILAPRKSHPAARARAWSYTGAPACFYEGPMPAHESSVLTPMEQLKFIRIAAELDFEWISRVMNASREARERD